MNRKVTCVLVAALMCSTALTGCGVVDALMATDTKVNQTAYYGIEGDEAAVYYGEEQLEDNAILQDGTAYLSYEQVYRELDKRFFWDGGDELLFTDAEQIHTETITDSSSLLIKEDQLYLSTDFLLDYLDVEIETYENPGRVYLLPAGTERTLVTVKKNTEVRTLGGYKSPILTDVRKGDRIYLLYEHNKWAKVMTGDGYIGYVLLDAISQEGKETTTIPSTKSFASYESISLDEKVCLIWQDMANVSGNGVFESLIKQTEGVNVVSPAWLALKDNEGGYQDLTSKNYVNTAHELGMQVWVLVDDFDQNMSIGKVLGDNEIRQKLVESIVETVISVDADGINVDFEYISDNSGKAFIQFLRELYIRCHKEGLILSVDNKNPTYVRYCYDMEEQGKIADYVILMGYDEHYAGSEAGSVASISYVQKGIEAALEAVDSTKIISGLPFYTRVWTEMPEAYAQAGEEIRNDGNSEYESYTLASSAVSMDEAARIIKAAGATLTWDSEIGQNYTEFPYEHGKKRIWLEDTESMQLKLSKVSEYNLAGVAFWRLGMDNNAVWEKVVDYLGK